MYTKNELFFTRLGGIAIVCVTSLFAWLTGVGEFLFFGVCFGLPALFVRMPKGNSRRKRETTVRGITTTVHTARR